MSTEFAEYDQFDEGACAAADDAEFSEVRVRSRSIARAFLPVLPTLF
jgi:hypothetical protein